MRSLFAAAACAAAWSGHAFAEKPPQPGAPTKQGSGRYQLMDGSYDRPVNNAPPQHGHSVFRIDTATGQVWELVPGAVDSEGAAQIDHWLPLPEDEKASRTFKP